jgi:hypothetical protein
VAERRPGLREALFLGALSVGVVAAAAILTSILPAEARDIVVRAPLIIGILIAGTAGVLWGITRPRHPDR